MVLRMARLASRVYQRPVPSRFCCTTVSFGARGLLILRTQKAREERDQSYCCEFVHGTPRYLIRVQDFDFILKTLG
jgi:hypothetical protein